MFNNLEELRNEILSGKTNEDIIRERIAYLTSKKYRDSRLSTIRRPNTSQTLFYDGFINPEEAIAFNGGQVSDCLYKADIDTSIYEELINLVRDNIDKKEFSFKLLIQKVRKYFQIDESSKYFELSQYLKALAPKDPYFARKELPYIITEYANSNYSGRLMDFGMGYVQHWYKNKGYKTDNPNIEELDEKYYKSIDWDKSEDGDIVLPISAIKGSGIAACTEYSMLTQNCLSFLGYDTYLLGGELAVGKKQEQHNFNVIRMPSDGGYAIVDSAQCVACKKIENANNIDDIRNMQGVSMTRSTKDATEVSYTSAPEIRTKTLLEHKEEQLSKLEAEANEYDQQERTQIQSFSQKDQNI